jgi:hypothetical protein
MKEVLKSSVELRALFLKSQIHAKKHEESFKNRICRGFMLPGSGRWVLSSGAAWSYEREGLSCPEPVRLYGRLVRGGLRLACTLPGN